MARTPPGQILRLRHTVNKRAVRILLECILVSYKDFNAALTNYFQAFILQHIRLHLSATARQVMMVYDTCF